MKPGRRSDNQTWPDPGPKPEAIWVPINRLSVDVRYQRSLEGRRSQILIRDIAENWSFKKAGTLGVSPSAFENFALWDGQHRWAAAKLRGDITELLCLSSDAPTLQEQAQLFLDANKRVNVHMYAMYHASVAAGKPDAVAVANVCRDAGVRIARYPIPASKMDPDITLAIGSIKKAIRLRGEENACQALLVLRTAFPDTAGAIRAHLIDGVSTVLALNEDITIDRLTQVIAAAGLRSLERKVQDIMIERGDSRSQAVTTALRELARAKPTHVEPQRPLPRIPVVTTTIITAKPDPKPLPPRAAAPAAVTVTPIKFPKPQPAPRPAPAAPAAPATQPKKGRDVTAQLMGDPDPKRSRPK